MIKPELFGPMHLTYLAVFSLAWILIPYMGYKYLNKSQRRTVIWILVVITLGQEVADYINRYHLRGLNFTQDLPLHMCGFSFYLALWTLIRKNQTTFELAYYWGLAGAIQVIITPEMGEFTDHLTTTLFLGGHALIILIVLWLVFVDGMRCRKGSLLNVILITNASAFLIAFINQALGANYMYLCRRPESSSPFLIGEWPYYLIGIEVFAFLFMGLLYLPMAVMNKRS